MKNQLEKTMMLTIDNYWGERICTTSIEWSYIYFKAQTK